MSDVVVQKKPKKSFKLFIMLLPCLAFVFIFSYLPLRGWIYAFTDYKAGLPWSKVNFVGLDNFTKMFANEALRAKVGQVMINTVAMAALNIVFSPLAATVMSAVPDGESTSRRWETSTPWAARCVRRLWPARSVPTAPTKRVGMPERAAAAAWLAPFPPRP